MDRLARKFDTLRDGIGNGGCGMSKVHTVQPVVWAFWHDDTRVAKFARENFKTTLFLSKWLTLAFLLESLKLTYIPANRVASAWGVRASRRSGW